MWRFSLDAACHSDANPLGQDIFSLLKTTWTFVWMTNLAWRFLSLLAPGLTLPLVPFLESISRKLSKLRQELWLGRYFLKVLLHTTCVDHFVARCDTVGRISPLTEPVSGAKILLQSEQRFVLRNNVVIQIPFKLQRTIMNTLLLHLAHPLSAYASPMFIPSTDEAGRIHRVVKHSPCNYPGIVAMPTLPGQLKGRCWEEIPRQVTLPHSR